MSTSILRNQLSSPFCIRIRIEHHPLAIHHVIDGKRGKCLVPWSRSLWAMGVTGSQWEAGEDERCFCSRFKKRRPTCDVGTWPTKGGEEVDGWANGRRSIRSRRFSVNGTEGWGGGEGEGVCGWRVQQQGPRLALFFFHLAGISTPHVIIVIFVVSLILCCCCFQFFYETHL